MWTRSAWPSRYNWVRFVSHFARTHHIFYRWLSLGLCDGHSKTFSSFYSEGRPTVFPLLLRLRVTDLTQLPRPARQHFCPRCARPPKRARAGSLLLNEKLLGLVAWGVLSGCLQNRPKQQVFPEPLHQAHNCTQDWIGPLFWFDLVWLLLLAQISSDQIRWVSHIHTNL